MDTLSYSKVQERVSCRYNVSPVILGPELATPILWAPSRPRFSEEEEEEEEERQSSNFLSHHLKCVK